MFPSDRLRRLLGLVAAAFILGLVATPTVSAQEEQQPDVDQFGGFIASARSDGIQITYDLPGQLATGDRVIDIAVPEARATVNSGPVGYGLASLAFPGPLLADLGAAIEAGGTDNDIPPYPVRAEAFFPAGPTEAGTGGGGTSMSAITDFADSKAQAHYGGLQIPPVVDVGAVEARSRSFIEGDQLVARTRSALSDVSILAGLVHIDSVITDVVATSNGETAATDGTTTVTGATVLGLPVTIDTEGIHFDADDDEQAPIPGTEDLVLPPEIGESLGDATSPLNDLFDQIGATGDDAFQQLFEASGVEIKLAGDTESVEGGFGARTANGLSITLNYDGSNTPVLTDLLGLVPSEDLPDDYGNEDLNQIPITPQGLFLLLEKTHITGLNVAPGSVSTEATPAFEFVAPSIAITTPTPPVVPAPATTIQPSFSDDFVAPTPDLPAAGTTTVSTVPAASPGSLLLGHAIPALVVFALALAGPFFGAGSMKLADNTLAAIPAGTCPDGADQPHPTGRGG